MLRIYAIASRVVCASPESMALVTQTLSDMAKSLVAPESMAAGDCEHLWKVFARVASHPKPFLRQEASKALYRDLDSIGQRLHLAPLPPWSQLPENLGGAQAMESADTVPEGLTADAAAHQAQKLHAELGAGETLQAGVILQLLSRLQPRENQGLLKDLQRAGRLSRGEVSMLERARATGHALSADDEILIEVLERVGVWLVQHTS